MDETWQYQLRIDLDEHLADIARRDAGSEELGLLPDILRRHDAVLKCQFDAFAGYVAEAEQHGVDEYPLYRWTKTTIEDPVKKAKYQKSFTLYVGGKEVYPREQADALEAKLQPLAASGMLTRLSKHDTNPANNPQPPAHLRG